MRAWTEGCQHDVCLISPNALHVCKFTPLIAPSRFFIWRSRVPEPAWVRFLGVLAVLLPGRRRLGFPSACSHLLNRLLLVAVRAICRLLGKSPRFRLFGLLLVLHGDVNSRFFLQYMLSSWFLRPCLSTSIVWLLLLPSDSQLSSSSALNVLAIFPSERVTSCPTTLFLSEHCSHHSFHAESLLMHLVGWAIQDCLRLSPDQKLCCSECWRLLTPAFASTTTRPNMAVPV